MDFKGLPNGANFILIDHCVGELLSINKVSSEHEHTIVQRTFEKLHRYYAEPLDLVCFLVCCLSCGLDVKQFRLYHRTKIN